MRWSMCALFAALLAIPVAQVVVDARAEGVQLVHWTFQHRVIAVSKHHRVKEPTGPAAGREKTG